MKAGRGHVQRGSSLVVAIFLIVVIASLAAFAVTAGTSTRDRANLQLQTDRALAAARAGSEWAAYRALKQNTPNCNAVTPASNTTTLTLNQGSLRGFRVLVAMTCTRHTEGATTYSVWDVDSFAQWSNFGAADYASRRVLTRVSNAP
jgi:MSHA biogenesis protein MshP